jgi:hypothetical protein
MTDRNNIIPLKLLKNRALHDARMRAADPILERLKGGDCSREWYPIFARNLGDMATHLDPAKPKKAARRMFDEAFGQQAAEANWRKRKRYLRFLGEEAPFLRDGDYAARNEPYLNLAGTYAKLCLPADRDGLKKACRLLVKGTSLGSSVDVSKVDGLTQALECLKRVQERCTSDPEIVEAYSYLSRFPIAPFAAHGIKISGDTRDLSIDDLVTTVRGKGLAIVPAPTSTISAYIDSANSEYRTTSPNYIHDELQPWYAGRLLLGYVYFPQTISRLKLPVSAAEFDEKEDAALETASNNMERDEVALNFVREIISKALGEKEISNFWPGDEYYSETGPIPDTLKYTIHIRKPVYLLLTHNGEQIELMIDISGEQFVGSKYREPEVYRRGQTPEEDEVAMPPVGDGLPGVNVWLTSCDGAWDWGFRVLKSEGNVYVIGGPVMRDYDTRSYSATINDKEMRDALFEGGNCASSIFKPVIWDDLTRLSAAPQGSIAGAILRNLAGATEEDRLDTLLLKDVREHLEGIVEFVRQELGKTADALRERGLDT